MTATAHHVRVRTPTVLQMEAVECGAASLAMILAYYGRRVPLEELRVACGVTRDGSTAGNLLRAARTYGLTANGYRWDVEALQQAKPPFIIFWQFYHFMVVEGWDERGVYFNDPAGGRKSVDWEEFDRSYTGIALTFERGPDFVTRSEVRPTAAILMQQLAGSRGSVLFATLCGIALAVPGIALPTFVKTFIDEVLVAHNAGWSGWILLGLALTIALQVVLLELQQRAIVRLQSKLALSNAARFFWHVLHLPMTFFAQRSPGEVGNRVGINDRIAELLSGRLAASAIGLLTALIYLGLMISYDAVLAAVSFAIAGLNILALRVVGGRRSDANAAVLQEEAHLLGLAISGLQNLETIKAGGAEDTFFIKWLGRQARAVNARQAFGVPSQFLNAAPRFLITFNTTAVLALGGLRVMDGAISIGTLFAFLLLMQLFTTPFTTFVELGADLQEMDGAVRRVEDVLHYPGDPPPLVQRVDRVRLTGEIRVSDLVFGYSKLGDPAIAGISFTIAPGQRIALVGSSGSGKSTVAKLISGLYIPWSGDVRFDGVLREAIDPLVFAADVAFVDQDISLYPGTLRSNISLWDPAVSDAAIERAARDACIHQDIIERPDAYDAIVSEGGVNFSGGQRQRLEIARALVRNPSIVVMDEATSALDPLTERTVDENLRRRGCSCLIIAHRLSTIRDADQILVLERGAIVERGTHEELLEKHGRYVELVTSS